METALTQNSIESMPYQKGWETLWDVQKRVRGCFSTKDKELENSVDSKKHFILNIGGNKYPEFAFRLAGLYPGDEIHHLCGNRNKPKIFRGYDKENLTPICDNSLEPIYNGDKKPFYDMVISFLTLHELEKPNESIVKASQVLKPGGIIVAYDYNLSWWAPLVAKEGWDKDTEEENFAKYVFTKDKEQKVLGFEKGVKIPKGSRMLKILKGIIEVNCIENHTGGGLEGYFETLRNANIQPIEMVKYSIKILGGNQPKMFLYIGKKV